MLIQLIDTTFYPHATLKLLKQPTNWGTNTHVWKLLFRQ